MTQSPSRKKKKKHGEGFIDASIAQFFNFTADDLDANRAGYMTENQRRHLHQTREAGFQKAWMYLIGLIAVVIAFRLLNESRGDAPPGVDQEMGLIVAAVLIALLVIVFVVVLIWQRRKVRRAVKFGAVEEITGTIGFSTESRSSYSNGSFRSTTVYYIHLDDEKKSIKHNEYTFLQPYEGEAAMVYYNPDTGQIVSMELLSPI